MSRKVYLWGAVLFALSSIGGSLSISSQAHAASPYDNAWRHTTDISLQSPSCGAVDKSSEIAAQLASNSGWPSSATRDYYHAITTGSTPGFISITKTHQVGTSWKWVSLYVQQGTVFDAIWGTDGDEHYIRVPGPSFAGTPYSGSWFGFMLNDSTCDMTFGSIGGSSVAYISNEDDPTIVFSQENIDLLFKNGAFLRPNYPAGYAGVDLGSTSADTDGDLLTEAQEFRQGTSDGNKDTDGDGLNDKTESVLNITRDNQFCDTSTPKNCAYPDPTKKDLYVEIDWMDDGTTEYKPSSTQIGLVEAAFNNKDINLHIDTGQFGGGNELSTYTQTLRRTVTTGQVDFWDYRNGGDGITANFSSDRNSIWRYMIYGYNYLESTDSSGWAETMGDDIFISGGLIDDMAGLANEDRAIANTMMHEMGHNLCLSGDKIWEEQPVECAYDGIDNGDPNDAEYNIENYESVMNYRYQLTDVDDMGNVDYSDGTHGSGDHDDWDGAMKGMGGFSGTHTLDGAKLAIEKEYYRTPDGGIVIEETPMNEIIKNNEEQIQNTQSLEEENKTTTGEERILSNQDNPNSKSNDDQNQSANEQEYLFLASGAGLLLVVLGVVWYREK